MVPVSELMRRCAEANCPQAWSEFQSRFSRSLRYGVRSALRRAGRSDGEPIEDHLQDVYCHLIERDGWVLRRCRAQDEIAVRGYLARVSEYVVLDRLRAGAAAKRGSACQVPWEYHETRNLPSARPSPEDHVLIKERKEVFLKHCRRLLGCGDAPRDLHILRLAYVDGFSSGEISRMIGKGLTRSGVDSVVHRIRRRLRALGYEMPHR